jgi:ferredoxin--NADP+ reductase
MAFPTAVALKQAGNEVIVIEGARRKDLIVLEDEVRAALDEFYVMTDDGSHGEQGLVTKKLEDLLNTRKIDFVLACGPVPMMRAIKDMTLPRNIPTMVSLNSIMVDGTGMCGGCRVLVGNTSKFACVDGPEFDAAMVNFDVLTQRNAAYREKETQSLNAFLADPSRDLALVKKNVEHAECAALAGGSDGR